MLGTASLALGPTTVLIGLIGILVVCLAVKSPEFVIVVLLAFVLELIPPRFNVSIPLFVGRFFVTDLLLLLLFSIVLLRLLTDRSFRLAKTPLDTPLLLFCAAAIVGVATAVWRHEIKFGYTTPEARAYLYYLVFFVVVNLVKTRRQLDRLVGGQLLIAVLVAAVMVVQAMLGRSRLVMVASSVQGEDVIRLFNPGFVVCYISLIVSICSMALREEYRARASNYLLVLLLGLALVTTVTRNVLVSSAFALAALALVVRKSHLSRLAVSLSAIAAIALFLMAALALFGVGDRLLRYLSEYFVRTSRMFSTTILSTQENVLIRWREIDYAWQQITNHPILGVGFYTSYRPPFSAFEKAAFTHYLHNAYLSIWLKTGLFGLIPFAWLSWRFLSGGLRRCGDLPDPVSRSITLGFTLAYLGLLISNMVAPTLVQDRSALIFGVIMGVNEAVFLQSKVKTGCSTEVSHDGRA